MKNDKNYRYAAMILAAALCVGSLFPELIWNEAVCRVYDAQTGETATEMTGEALWEHLWEAEPEEYQIRSGLWKIWNALLKMGQKGLKNEYAAGKSGERADRSV